MASESVPWFCKSEALRLTLNTVELTKTVGRADPFHNATEFDSNPVPEIVMVAATPGGTAFGDKEVIDGVGLFTGKFVDADVPPPGAGFCTANVPCKLPERFAAASVAFTSVPLTNVVARAAPFHTTTEDRSNPAPFISTIMSGDPATTLVGLIVATVGAGLFTAKLIADDVPPLCDGFTTVRFATIPFTRLAAGNIAVKVVGDIKVVAIDVPFNWTAAPDTNPEPVIVTVVSGEPAGIDDGVTEAIVGAEVEVEPDGVAGPPPQPDSNAERHTTDMTNANLNLTIARSHHYLGFDDSAEAADYSHFVLVCIYSLR